MRFFLLSYNLRFPHKHFPISSFYYPYFMLILWIYFSWQACVFDHSSHYTSLRSHIAFWSELISDKYLNVCFRKWASETKNRNQECLIAQLGTQNYKGQVSKQLICCWKCILSRTIDCESLKGMNDKLYHFTSSGFSAVPGTQ